MFGSATMVCVSFDSVCLDLGFRHVPLPVVEFDERWVPDQEVARTLTSIAERELDCVFELFGSSSRGDGEGAVYGRFSEDVLA